MCTQVIIALYFASYIMLSTSRCYTPKIIRVPLTVTKTKYEEKCFV